MTSIIFQIGPFIGLAGFFLLIRHTITERIRSLKPLTQPTQAELEVVGVIFDEPHAEANGSPSIPVLDILSLYLNSREDRRLINLERLDTNRPDCALFLSKLERNHTRIKKLARAEIRERLRLVHFFWGGHHSYSYSRILLWTYAEEQELIHHLADYCPADRRPIMLSRLY